MRLASILAIAMVLALPVAADAAEAERGEFGTLPDGRAVEAITLSNDHGMSATILTWGATLESVVVPDRAGDTAEVTLGYDTLDGYMKAPNFFGASVGRYANRIKDGRFTLDGKSYQLARNNNGNSLHGGEQGFDKRLWTVDSVQGGKVASVTLSYISEAGEEGYPGRLTVHATYSLNEDNELSVDYRAETTAPTIVNLTNHVFFNLAGEASGDDIYGHYLTIPAEFITPVDATLIPTGELRPVQGTPFDFRTPMRIGARIRDASDDQIVAGQGYDENFVVARNVAKSPRFLARLEDPGSGRILDIFSNQPGLQVYTGNFLNGTAIGRSGLAYRQGDGIAMEPQIFPDTPNQPAFGSARLDRGETYHNFIVWRFSTTAPPAEPDVPQLGG